MRAAAGHHVGFDHYLRHWSRDARLAEQALKAYDIEHRYDSCPQCGVARSTWDPKHGGDVRRPSLVPEWRFCRPCQLFEQAQAAGPPGGKDAHGWHLEWVEATYDEGEAVSRG